MVYEKLASCCDNGGNLSMEYRVVAADGAIKWVYDDIALVRDEEGLPQSFQGMVTDITTRKRRELELEAMARVSRDLRKVRNFKDMPPILIDNAMSLLEAECALFAVEDEARDMLVEFASEECGGLVGSKMEVCDKAELQPMSNGEPCIFHDAKDDPFFEGAGLSGSVASSVWMPMVFHGHATGVLWLGLRYGVTDDDLRILSTVCELTANAIHREKLFDLTEQRLERLAALRLIDNAITGSLDLGVTLGVALDQVLSHLSADAADILLLNPYDNTLRFKSGKGFLTQRIRASVVPYGVGMAGRAALERRCVEANEQGGFGGGFTRRSLIADEGFTNAYALPLTAKGKVMGVLELFDRSAKPRNEDWYGFLDALATQIAIAVDNATVYDDLQHSNDELKMAYDATLEGWAHALGYRDKETEGHSRRVTEMTVELAKLCGVPESEMLHVRRGALLHDIGKIGIPDGILLKEGSLTDEEWVIMKKHPEYSFMMLSPILYLKHAMDIPYCHHEKWDGTGYPRGLSGEQIPLAARIFAVVDVWDALLSDRPYRKGWPVEKVREHMVSLKGKQFDPNIVDLFLGIEWKRD